MNFRVRVEVKAESAAGSPLFIMPVVTLVLRGSGARRAAEVFKVLSLRLQNYERNNYCDLDQKSSMNNLYSFQTRIGIFYIAEFNGRFHPVWNGESLGSYYNVQQAIDDLAGGYTFSLSSGVDTASLGISEDLADWVKLKPEYFS